MAVCEESLHTEIFSNSLYFSSLSMCVAMLEREVAKSSASCFLFNQPWVSSG